jgi:dihydrofolate synthase / folylpolyglutamate synthase
MTLKEKIAFIESRPRFKPKTSLDHLKEVFESLNISLPTIKIHVVGTNGKGSTTMMTSNILSTTYKTGAFVSPYVYRFNERILIDGKEISDDILEHGLDEVLKVYNHYPTLTFFELLTLMALIIFSKEQCEAIVMEAGIGGRLDATNILTYTYALIVSVGHDHLNLLGPTLEDVLREKLGVVKPDGHLLSTVDKSFHPFIKDYVSKIIGSRVSFLDTKPFEITSLYPLTFTYQESSYTLSFIGNHYASNARLAIEVGHLLHIPNVRIQKALEVTSMPGRFEKITKNVYVDGAHNKEAIDVLFHTLTTQFKDIYKIIIISVLGDKDITSMLQQLKHPHHKIILTSFDDPRYQDISMHATKEILFIKDPVEAYRYATTIKEEASMIICTGSIHFIGFIGSKIKETL